MRAARARGGAARGAPRARGRGARGGDPPGRARADSAGGGPGAEQAAHSPLQAEDCSIPFVTVEPGPEHGCTVLRVATADRPGVMRSLCWTINGLGLVVERAVLKSEGGEAENTFYVTSGGEPVREPEQLVQHVEMVLQQCVPLAGPTQGEGGRLRQGPVTVDNEYYADRTVVTVTAGEDVDSPGLLLSLCTVLSAMRMQIAEAVVCRECDDLLPAGSVDDDLSLQGGAAKGRTFRFHVQSLTGGPLDYETAAAALFSLNLVISRRPEESTTPPTLGLN